MRLGLSCIVCAGLRRRNLDGGCWKYEVSVGLDTDKYMHIGVHIHTTYTYTYTSAHAHTIHRYM